MSSALRNEASAKLLAGHCCRQAEIFRRIAYQLANKSEGKRSLWARVYWR